MYCPFCTFEETKVIDSRLSGEGQQVRRRRECLRCGERFTTFEFAELVMPRVVKSDATREPFDEAKLRSGMVKALEKRPVAIEAVDAAVNHVCHKLRTLGEQVRQEMSTVPGVVDLSLEPQVDVPVLRVQFDRQALARHGLHVREVDSALQAAIQGVARQHHSRRSKRLQSGCAPA